ncbi:transferrin-binding protein-like solute binding protein [Pseudogemmobacter sonorensis]|uniref:transferrin-binding protein-like solute binding protein n=1 Tax=Pseudogemmobacter sonorensis TaxID=2989681 RepID=UPI0036C33BDC
MTFVRRTFPTLSALCLLAACGGGGSDNPAADYSSDAAGADRLTAETASLTQTAAASMPTTGRAEYDGVVGMAFGSTPTTLSSAEMLGEVDLTANFATGQITGEFDDFNTAAGQELNGTLRVSNGQIVGNAFSADIAGNLTGTTSAPGAVSGSVSGDFLGTNASAIEGTGTASSTAGDLGLVFVGTLDRD